MSRWQLKSISFTGIREMGNLGLRRGEIAGKERGQLGTGFGMDTFECFEEVVALEDGVVFPSMPRKFGNDTHQTLIRSLRTLTTIWRLP
jgi:hypothetical protein